MSNKDNNILMVFTFKFDDKKSNVFDEFLTRFNDHSDMTYF